MNYKILCNVNYKITMVSSKFNKSNDTYYRKNENYGRFLPMRLFCVIRLRKKSDTHALFVCNVWACRVG